MKAPLQSKGLVVLAADRDIEEALRQVLRRPESVGMRRVPFECRRHPNRDGGCRASAADFLRPFRKRFSHALVVFDRHGCGSSEARGEIEQHVESELARNGWQDRGKAIVIDPELEAWLWSNSPAVPMGLVWNGRYGELKSWLQRENVWGHSSAKPDDPKAALNRTLLPTRLPTGSPQCESNPSPTLPPLVEPPPPQSRDSHHPAPYAFHKPLERLHAGGTSV